MTTACAPKAGALRRALAPLNAAAALLLLTAGGMVTSTDSGLAVPDWPLSCGQWLPKMYGGVFYEHGHRMIAAGVGFLILVMALLTQWEERRPTVRRLAWATLFLVVIQGVLGAVIAATAFRLLPEPRASRAMIAIATSHLAVGAFLLGSAAMLTTRLLRLRPGAR